MNGKAVLKLGIFEKIPVLEWKAFAVQRQNWERPLDDYI